MIKRILLTMAILTPCVIVIAQPAINTNTVSLALTNTCDGSWSDFSFKNAGYDNQEYKFTYTGIDLTNGMSFAFRLAKPMGGPIYNEIASTAFTDTSNTISWSIAHSNIPPTGVYYGELLAYTTANSNTYRSIAQGKLNVTWSLYLIDSDYFASVSGTNATVGEVYVHPSWVMPPWSGTATVAAVEAEVDILNTNTIDRTGARGMQANLNMGGYSVTNIGTSSIAFSDGVSITSTKIQLYDTLNTAKVALTTYIAYTNAQHILNTNQTARIVLMEAVTGVNAQAVTDSGAATNWIATNTLQAQITTNLAIQANTNAGFEGRIGTNETDIDLVEGKATTNAANIAILETNALLKTGGTLSGAVYSTGTSALESPISSEIPTAGWVRGLFGGGAVWYNSTNVASSTNFYEFRPITQAVMSARDYGVVTQDQHVGTVITTARYTKVSGSISVSDWLIRSPDPDRLSMHPDISFSYDGTNAEGTVYRAEAQAIQEGTNLTVWIVPNISFTATNGDVGAFIMRDYHVESVFSDPELSVCVGGSCNGGISIPVATAELDVGVRGITNLDFTGDWTTGTWSEAERKITIGAPAYYPNASGDAASNLAYSASTNAEAARVIGTNVEQRVGSIETNSYQAFSATVSPDVGGTCTITYASGSLVKIDAGTNITLTFDNTDFPTNGVNRVGVEVWSPTNTVAFLDSVVTNEAALTFTNKYPASLFFRKTGTNTLWWGRN